MTLACWRLARGEITRRQFFAGLAAAGITLVAAVAAYVVAYVAAAAGPGQAGMIVFAVLLSFWLSVLIRSFAWIILSRNGSPLHELISLLWRTLADAGLVSGPLRLVRNDFGVLVSMVHFMLPYAILPLLANMKGIDRRAVLAARSLGASLVQASATSSCRSACPA